MEIPAIEFATEQTDSEKLIAETSEALAAYTEVRDMVQLPGWGRFITELHGRSKKAREEFQDALDGVLVEKNKTTEITYQESKIRLLAIEEAIQIYVKIKERAQIAKQILDRTPEIQAESPQNG